jgi:hypothetical protein
LHWEHVSEWDFLLTELQYTVAQLKVQLDGIEDKPLAPILGHERSPTEILGSMLKYEVDFQARYLRDLKAEDSVRPPQIDSNNGERAAFARLRSETIEILRRISGEPSNDLLKTVRDHLGEDRRHVTALAECRHRLLTRM